MCTKLRECVREHWQACSCRDSSKVQHTSLMKVQSAVQAEQRHIIQVAVMDHLLRNYAAQQSTRTSKTTVAPGVVTQHTSETAAAKQHSTADLVSSMWCRVAWSVDVDARSLFYSFFIGVLLCVAASQVTTM